MSGDSDVRGLETEAATGHVLDKCLQGLPPSTRQLYFAYAGLAQKLVDSLLP